MGSWIRHDLAHEGRGDSWVVQRTSDESLNDVAFATQQQGIAVGNVFPGIASERLILVTRDGGQTWTRAPIDGRERRFGQNAALRNACFTATGIGLAVGDGVDGNAVLLSADSGVTWPMSRTASVRPALLLHLRWGFRAMDRSVQFPARPILRRRDDLVDATSGLPDGFDGQLLGFAFIDRQRGWAGGVETTATHQLPSHGGRWGELERASAAATSWCHFRTRLHTIRRRRGRRAKRDRVRHNLWRERMGQRDPP